MVHALARHPGHVKDRDALMRDAHIVVDDSTITSHVKRIRRKFLAVDPAFDRIATVYGMGYRWSARADPPSVAPASRCRSARNCCSCSRCSSRCRGSASSTCASWSACCATRRSARSPARRRRSPPRCTTGRGSSRRRPTRLRRSRASAPTTGVEARRIAAAVGVAGNRADHRGPVAHDGAHLGDRPRRHVLARAGTLKRAAGAGAGRVVTRRAHASRATRRPPLRAGAGAADARISATMPRRGGAPRGRDVEGALAGILTTDRRPHVRRQGGDRQRRASGVGRRRRCAASVIAEETGNAVLAQRNRAFERLFNIVLAVLLVGSLALTAVCDVAVVAHPPAARRRRARDRRAGPRARAARELACAATRSATCRAASRACSRACPTTRATRRRWRAGCRTSCARRSPSCAVARQPASADAAARRCARLHGARAGRAWRA